MKVKNVLKGLSQQYDLEEITIIDSDRICYSGTMDNWKTPDKDMIFYKRQIMESDAIAKLVHCNKKAFVFIGDPCNKEK